jgi:hypothetical protein
MTEMTTVTATRLPASSRAPAPATAATASPAPLPGVVQTSAGDGLSLITAPDATLAVWARPAVPEILAEIAACAPLSAPALRAELATTELMQDAKTVLSGRLAPFWVGILKGERYPGNAGRGQVHRSPPVADGVPPRLLFCLDT